MSELEWAIQNAEKMGAVVCKEYIQQTIPMIGFKLKNKHVYHWFCITESGFLLFNHSYSMNTGKSKRGVTARMHACNMFLPLGINHAL